MKKPNSIIPEFMTKNKDDTFMFLMPLRLKIDYEDYGNSMFKVAVKNITKNEFFDVHLSPELFFTKFRFHQPYKNGKQDKKSKSNLLVTKKQIDLSQHKIIDKDIILDKLIDEDKIVELLGWKRTYLNNAKKTPCFKIDNRFETIILPHYAVAIYYYYRTTVMREAVLRCKLDDLYIAVHNDGTNASITIPKYVTKAEAPFVCRFATSYYSQNKFEDIGKYINTYIDYIKRETSRLPNDMPIKAKLPVSGDFSLKAKVHEFWNNGKKIVYVHEILDDNSDIGFKRLQVLRESKTSSIDLDEFENLPTVKKEIPGVTTEVLKVEGASKKKQHRAISSKRRSCSSLDDIEITEDTVASEDIPQVLKIYQEEMANEVVDQSLTESSKNIEKKIRKTRISNEYAKKEREKKEYTHNFDEFSQYMNFLATHKSIKNFIVHGNQKMQQVIDPKTDRAYARCSIAGRERQYITATFQYDNVYVGLLELENTSGSAASTWVISSCKPINQMVFDKFLQHYVDEQMNINDIKDFYQGNNELKFATKNHERNEVLKDEDLARWMVGVLGKLLCT